MSPAQSNSVQYPAYDELLSDVSCNGEERKNKVIDLVLIDDGSILRTRLWQEQSKVSPRPSDAASTDERFGSRERQF